MFTKQSAVENKKTYTFKNCKFRNVRTEFFSSENVIFKFENCSFTGFAGSDAIFDKCYFGGTTSDGWKLSTDKMTLTKTYTKNTTEDGENIIIKDLAGNSTVVNVKVTSIDESEPTFTLNKYKIKNNCIIKIKPNTDYNTFIRDISTNRDYEVKDGNRILSGTDMIKTGQKLINGLGQTYTLVVTGDLNGDGKISLVELARISKTGDGKINIIDMAAISKEYKAQK